MWKLQLAHYGFPVAELPQCLGGYGIPHAGEDYLCEWNAAHAHVVQGVVWSAETGGITHVR